MNDLSPANKYNLTMFAIKRFGTDQLPLLDSRPSFPPLAPVRVEVARTEPERPLTAMTQAQYLEWCRAIGGEMGIGPSLEQQRRARQKAFREALAFVLIGIGAIIGGLIVIWSFASIVRMAIG